MMKITNMDHVFKCKLMSVNTGCTSRKYTNVHSVSVGWETEITSHMHRPKWNSLILFANNARRESFELVVSHCNAEWSYYRKCVHPSVCPSARAETILVKSMTLGCIFEIYSNFTEAHIWIRPREGPSWITHLTKYVYNGPKCDWYQTIQCFVWEHINHGDPSADNDDI